MDRAHRRAAKRAPPRQQQESSPPTAGAGTALATTSGEAGNVEASNWFTRLVFLSYRPLGRINRRLQWAGLVLVLWGEALLPGAMVITLFGLLFLAVSFGRSAVHLLWYYPLAILARYRAFQPEQRRWAPWLALVAVASALAFDVPARLTLTLAGGPVRAALHDVYAVQPYHAQPPTLRVAGPFLLANFQPSPTRVHFEFAFGRGATYTEPDGSGEGILELENRSFVVRLLLFMGLHVGRSTVRCG